MHFITDLSAETVSYINIIQDICKNNLPGTKKPGRPDLDEWARHKTLNAPGQCNSNQKKRIGELIWSSKGDTVPVEMVESFYEISQNLLLWLNRNLKRLHGDKQKFDLFVSLFAWRHLVRDILYEYPGERFILAEIIHYMPLQVIQILSLKESNLYDQRLYQIYKPDFTDLFSKEDVEKLNTFWGGSVDGIQREQLARSFMENDNAILRELIDKDVPLPFETLYKRELDEIQASRIARLKGKIKWDAPDSSSADPLKRAAEMKLSGLALSGGGIRSATFNLGLLQKLAELEMIPMFDYMSTVSGGGYLGTWFCAWIRQTCSLFKVTERLNPKVSPQPHAEEVRPIRWLRMFSNYLSPNASIMSDDAWALGITWLRNSLINQAVLLLMLLSVLCFIDAAFLGWQIIGNIKCNPFENSVWIISIILLLPGTLLAASGMRSYDRDYPPQSQYNIGRSSMLAHWLVIWGMLTAFLVTTWFHVILKESYSSKLDFLWPGAAAGCCCMLLLAYFGKYYSPASNNQKNVWPFAAAIVVSSGLAAVATLFLLALSWQVIDFMGGFTIPHWLNCVDNLREKVILLTGIPLILEVLSVCVVVRMVVMGKLFPDERREWWGRLGGYINRFILLWILIAGSVLIVPGIFTYILESDGFKTGLKLLIGSWATLIAGAVRLAYGSRSNGEKKQSGAGAARELIVLTGPYLFMVAILLIGTFLVSALETALIDKNGPEARRLWQTLLLAAGLGLLTWFLGWRVGVNEFSLHHFYRNRLVRAFLGAARRRTDRENTANTFTGFDKGDDFPLAELVTGRQYFGPYPLINTALNASIVYELDRQDRKAESFVFSPLFCGFDFSPVRSASYTRNKIYDYAYRPTDSFSSPGGPLAGTAMAISGAAVNPNMGYHSNSAAAFLLTVFNVRLGWWIGNPLMKKWKKSSPGTGIVYLVKDLIGKSNISTDFVCLSDGGHFDNMGLYELVRRRCVFIVLGDAEQDEKVSCEGLANAIRRCFIDFGVIIHLDISKITRKDRDTGLQKSHMAQGKIIYPGLDKPGKIIYVKASLTKKTPVDVREYAINNPEFPQQSTGDQFFDENQFESYRKLGYTSLTTLQDLQMKKENNFLSHQ